MFNYSPHEYAVARRDIPGEEIPAAYFLFDKQCAKAYAKLRKRIAKTE